MNRGVRAVMFTTPVMVYPVTEKDSSGDRTTLPPFELRGYVYDKVVITPNKYGEQEISSRQIYLAGADISGIESSYLISCLGSDKAKIIHREEFRGRAGRTLIGVIYIA